MITEIAMGVAIAAGALAIIYFLWWKKDSLMCHKRIEGGKSIVEVKAGRKLRRITVKETIDGEEVVFSRENVAKGEEIKFSYPFSMDRARIIIEDDKGIHEFEVAPK